MGDKKFLAYNSNNDLQKFLKETALTYVNFRYNSTYELEVCNDLVSIYKSLNEKVSRVDYCCFYIEEESEFEIYKQIKKEFPNLPVLLFAYVKLDHSIFFRPGLFPESLINVDIDPETNAKNITDKEMAIANLKEFLDSYQPDELNDHRKSILSKPDRSKIFLISGEEIISVESVKKSGNRLQKILTTRGVFFCKQSISEIEENFATMLYRCKRDALINKSLIVGCNVNNWEIELSSGDCSYTVKASRDKFNQIRDAYEVFFKNAIAC